MADPRRAGTQTPGFTLGAPVLVCRWRLAGGTLPLENRHLRALGARELGGQRVPQPLVAWAKQHVEWTLREGSAAHPDGVLMLVVDERGQAAMTVGPYEPLADRRLRALCARACDAAAEAARTGVAPESLWLVRPEGLVWGARRAQVPSATDGLMADLAATIGFPVARDEGLCERLAAVAAGGPGPLVPDAQEAFLVSDEHGFVPASDLSGPRSERFAADYARLLARSR